MPTWSKDGNRLYFSSQRGSAQFDIFSAVVGPDGHSGPAERLEYLIDYEDPGAFEHLAQCGSPTMPNVWARLLDLWPWLLPIPLLIALALWLCRKRKYPETVELSRDVSPHPPEIVMNQGEFLVKLSLIPRPDRCRKVEKRQPVDVVLVTDVSGSMSEQQGTVSRLDGAKRAAKAFVKELNVGPEVDHDRVAIIGFAEQARLVEPLSGDVKQIERGLDHLAPSGGTAIDAGLTEAVDHLKESGRAGVAPVIVLLSDGEQEEITLALEEARRAQGEGIRVVTVGLGSEVGEELLRLVASDPNDYRFTPDPAELKELYRQIAVSFQKPVVARDLTFMHTFDAETFELIPDSVYPPAPPVEGNRIIWTVAELGQAPRTFSYQVKPKRATEAPQNIDLGDTLTYTCCEDVRHRRSFDPDLPVVVREGPEPSVVKIKKRQLRDPLSVGRAEIIWKHDPALVIGLGYAGRWVLTHLKKDLRDAGAGYVSNRIPLLLLDTGRYKTDLEQGKTQPVSFVGVELDEDRDHLVIFDENLKAVINSADQDLCLQDWVPMPSDFGYDDHAKSLRYGTGGRRALGRMGLVHQPPSTGQPFWTQKLWPTLLKLMPLVKTEHGVQIIIAGSLAEGMGAMLIDLVHLARQAAYCACGGKTEVNVGAYLSVTYDQDGDSPGVDNTLPLNTMASLRELERFRLHPGLPLSLGYQVKPDACESIICGSILERSITDLYLFGEIQEQPERTLYPVMADLIALRLDRGLWSIKEGGKEQDRLEIERKAAAGRERERDELHFGTAGVASVQVPAADIVERLKIRFARELLHAFLAGDSREPVHFEPALATLPGMSSPSADTVARALLDGELGWELEIDCPTGATAFVKATQGSLEPAMKTRLQRMGPDGRKQDAEQFQRYLGEVTTYLLTGSEGLTHPLVAPHLAFVLELLREVKNRVQASAVDQCISTLSQDPPSRKAGRILQELRADYCAVLDGALSELQRLAGLITNQVFRTPQGHLGLYEALENLQREAEQWPDQLAGVACRQHIWEVDIQDSSGNRVSQKLEDIWFSEYGAPKIEEARDYLGWEISPDGKIDLVLRTTGEQPQLRLGEVGVDAFLEGFLNAAGEMFSKVWKSPEGYIDFPGLKLEEQLDASLVTNLRWACWQINTGLARNPNYSATLVGPEIAANSLQDLQSQLGTSLQHGIEPVLRATSTNRYAIHLVRTMGQVPVSALHQYEKAQGFHQADRERRAVLAAEKHARELEREIVSDEEKRRWLGKEPFHSVIVSAFESEESRTRTRLFALALAAGWIELRGEKVTWQVPSTPAFSSPIPTWPDPIVWAFLEFALRPPDVEFVETVQAILDQPPAETLILAWRRWEEGIPREFEVEPRRSLARYTRSVVIDELRKIYGA